MITRSSVLIGLLFCTTQVWSIGNSPVPDIQNASLDASVSLVSGTPDNGEYFYAYEIAVGGSSTGHVWRFEIDVSARFQLIDPTRTFPVQDGADTRTTSDLYALLRQFGEFEGTLGSRIVEVGQIAPSGWNGGFTRAGTAHFFSGSQTPGVGAGQSLNGFEIRTSRPPMIRAATIEPSWFYVVDENGNVTQTELDQAQAIKAGLPISLSTLGPYDEGLGGSRHYNRLRDDMATAEALGWITDLTLSTTLRDFLGAAIAARDSSDGNTAIQTLESLKAALLAATPTSFRQEYFDLVLLNVDVLILRTEPTPILFEPELTITTNADELHVGETWEINVSYVNKAFNDEPIEGLPLFGRCDTVCANEDLLDDVFIETDSTGTGTFSLTGVSPGTDTIRLFVDDEAQEDLGTFEISWRAEADLVVPLFVPPIIETGGGEIVRITEITQNIGSTDAGASTTRYFISPDNPFDMNTATVVGDRAVDALIPDEESTTIELEVTMPASLAPGEYTVAACADADEVVAEASEANNCSFIQLENVTSSVGRVTDPSGNESNISVAGSSVTEADAGVVLLPFVVSIDQSDPIIDLVVEYQTQDGSATAGQDYIAQAGQLTFLANTTELTQTVDIDVLGDLLVEGDESFTLQIDSFSSTAVVSNSSAQGTIIDDDSVSVEVDIANATTAEGNSGQTNLEFSVSISQADPANPITVAYETQDGTALVSDNDYIAQSGNLSFAAGTTALIQLVSIPIIGDTIIEPDETFSVVLSNPSANAILGTASAQGTILNDDELPPNTPPSAQNLAIETPENTPISFQLMGQDEDGDALNFSVVTNPISGTLSGSAPNLTFTPVTEFFGQDSFTFIVSDGSLTSNEATVTITVTQVNVAPVADAGSDQLTVVGDTVVLDGSNSSDADGDSLDYSWSIVSAPSGSTAILDESTAVNPSLDTDLAGTYVIQLIVNDGTVDSGPDTMTIQAELRSVFLVLDEESIDSGSPPNFFLDGDVNSDIADLGLRTQLPVFSTSLGQTLALYSGEVGDEGWFALTFIPETWSNAGPTSNGLRNYAGEIQVNGDIVVGEGLGVGNDPEAFLDKVPKVVPLRATGLNSLVGQHVCAVVQDSDISINYDPIDGSLKGKSLGRVAFQVLSVTPLTGGSSSSLPEVEVEILDADQICEGNLFLLEDAPVPNSSSEPFDTGHESI